MFKYGSFTAFNTSLKIDQQTGLRVPTSTGPIKMNSLGFRSPELGIQKATGTIRLAFLGASTTFSAEASSNEVACPHLVWVQLQENYSDIEFDFVNAGGYAVDSSLRN